MLAARVNSPTPRIRAMPQLPFPAFMLSAVVRRRVSTSEGKSRSCVSTVRCKVPDTSVLVDKVLSVCGTEEAGRGLESFSGYILYEKSQAPREVTIVTSLRSCLNPL